MKKTFYILLVISSFFTVVGWGEQEVVKNTSADTPVVEEFTEITVEKVEEHVIDLIELPVIEFEELKAVSNEYAYTVTPGSLTNKDVSIGQDLASEFFQLLYNYSEDNVLNEETKEEMKVLLENPDRIEEFIIVRESSLGQYEKVKAVDVTSTFSEAFYSDNADNIVYYTNISMMTDEKDSIQKFKVHIVKMDDVLKVKRVQ